MESRASPRKARRVHGALVVERRGGSPGTQNNIECRWVGEDVIEVEKLIQYREQERDARGI